MAQFCNSDLFKKVVENVNHRLGFNDKDFDTREARVMNMYDLCRYENTWTEKPKSVWCSVGITFINIHQK